MLPLTGFTVGITGHRRAAEQAEMLTKRGADVIVGPVMQTVALADADATTVATQTILAGRLDILVLTTGVGTRSWLGVAESVGLDGALREVCHEATVLARGPKARSAAVAGGLEVSWQAPGETSAEILDHLAAVGIAGKRVAVQRDGSASGPGDLAAGLRELGADVIDVPVYRWQLPDDETPARRLIAAIAAGRVDAVTFTSAVAANSLFELTEDVEPVLQAFAGPALAVSVGPVTAKALHRNGVERVLEPPRARLGAMVQALVAELGGRRRRLSHGSAWADWQGAALLLPDAEPVMLTAGERRLLETFVQRSPAVVPKGVLVEPGTDLHAAEVAVARLRTKLGPLGAAIRTVPRRGYRCELVVGPAEA